MARQADNISVCVWQDTRPVTFVSLAHNPAGTHVISMKRGDGTLIDVNYPLSIIDYNKYMGVVDVEISFINTIMCTSSQISLISTFLVSV